MSTKSLSEIVDGLVWPNFTLLGGNEVVYVQCIGAAKADVFVATAYSERETENLLELLVKQWTPTGHRSSHLFDCNNGAVFLFAEDGGEWATSIRFVQWVTKSGEQVTQKKMALIIREKLIEWIAAQLLGTKVYLCSFDVRWRNKAGDVFLERYDIPMSRRIVFRNNT